MTDLMSGPPEATRLSSHRVGPIAIFRVADHAMQQEILRAFTTFDHPRVHALGTQNAHEWFILVECEGRGGLVAARRVVHTMDVTAVEVPHVEPHGGLLGR